MEGKQNGGYKVEEDDEIDGSIKAPDNEAEGQHFLSPYYKRFEKYINYGVIVALVIGFHSYLIYCIVRHIDEDIPVWSCEDCPLVEDDTTPPFWCNSFAMVIILTSLTWLGVIYGYVLKPLLGGPISRLTDPLTAKISSLTESLWVSLLLYAVVVGGILTYLIINALDDTRRFYSIAGYFGFLLLGWLGSAYPRSVRWRQVAWGLGIQFVFGMVVIKWDFGKDVVNCVSSKVTTFLGFSDYGATQIYGYLVNGQLFFPAAYTNFNNESDETVRNVLTAINDSGAMGNSGMMFKVLSLIYFLSFFVSMLYYLGVLQFIVLKLGWLLSITMGTTAAESMNAAANIFLGQTEAPLLIRPFLNDMTRSEVFAVMTGGFATIAGTVLGAYIGIGIDANNLITASFMAAPTALAVSKLFYPETEVSKTSIKDLVVEKGDDANVLDAAAKGASTAIMLILNIAASLVAFMSFIAFLDAFVAWFAGFAGDPSFNFQRLLGYLFWPLALMMGIRVQDCEEVATLIGMKLVVTEFPAFGRLGEIKEACESAEYGEGGCVLDQRSITLATFALCGFANVASMGMQVAVLGGLCPNKKSILATIVTRAMIAGCWVSFLNACLAGALL